MNYSGADRSSIDPLLVRYAVCRTGDSEIPGYYCNERDVWVVETVDGTLPVVEARGDLAEISTKTSALPEADDSLSSALLETVTKTLTHVEEDDATRSMSHLLELATKTEAQVERDDVSKGLEQLESAGSIPGLRQ